MRGGALIGHFDIFPNYWDGFSFSWGVSPDFTGALPWTFTVQESIDGEDWTDISPELINLVVYQEDDRRRVPKDKDFIFRVKAVSEGIVYYSDIEDPYAKFGKREYLLARDIMRRESLMLDKMSGVPVALYRYDPFSRYTEGSIDPISGIVIDDEPRFEAMYYGPFDTKAAFSTMRVAKEQNPDGSGIVDIRKYTIRMIGFPYISDNDIIVDTTQDRRYYVTTVQNVAEIRRYPIVQVMELTEAPKGDPAYML